MLGRGRYLATQQFDIEHRPGRAEQIVGHPEIAVGTDAVRWHADRMKSLRHRAAGDNIGRGLEDVVIERAKLPVAPQPSRVAARRLHDMRHARHLRDKFPETV